MTAFYIVTVLWIFSVCLHEYAHASAAYHGGDYTVAEKGYLTFNPLRYTDPIWSILMPLFFLAIGGIGLPGGAVYINRELLRSRRWDTLVSLAGPLANLIMAVVLGGLFATGLVKADPDNVMACSLAFLLRLQVSALVLNLLPIPPLDGFQAIAPWLGRELRDRAMGYSNLCMIVLFLAMSNWVPANHLFWNVVDGLTRDLGGNADLATIGWHEFQFWRR